MFYRFAHLIVQLSNFSNRHRDCENHCSLKIKIMLSRSSEWSKERWHFAELRHSFCLTSPTSYIDYSHLVKHNGTVAQRWSCRLTAPETWVRSRLWVLSAQCLYILPVTVWGFSRFSSFLPQPKDVQVGCKIVTCL